MAGYNRIVMVGNLTRDPEYKQLNSGQGVCRLGLASNRQFRNRQSGEMVQEVCYVDIDVWGPQADSCNQYLQKGRPVLVEGRLKWDRWEDQEGQARTKHLIVADRVVFLAGQGDEDVQAPQAAKPRAPQTPQEIQAAVDAVQPVKRTTPRQKPAATAPAAAAPAPQAAPAPAEFKDEPPFEDDLPF